MSTKKPVPAILVFSLAICMGPVVAHAADDGLITKPSKYSVEETVARFEAAVRQREAAGFTVFTEIDHAAAARKFGFDMRPRTVILFGNPKVGTPSVIKTPLVAIDLPPKALVWEDDQGKVWLSYKFCRTISSIRSTNGTVRMPLQQPRQSQKSWTKSAIWRRSSTWPAAASRMENLANPSPWSTAQFRADCHHGSRLQSADSCQSAPKILFAAVWHLCDMPSLAMNVGFQG
jgi:uncharacterized protein (DUF302 family)